MNLKALRSALERWRGAGLIDAGAAERIAAFEAERREASTGSLAQTLALALGGVLLTTGVLLFVAAHWDKLGPAVRFALVLALVVAAHGLAVLTRHSGALPVVLHAVGTGLCGTGIFLAGQIFHLQAHWPAAFMLWAAGAAAGWWLLRQWPQAVWLAVLAPIWLSGEYVERVSPDWQSAAPVFGGLLVVALCYLTLEPSGRAALGRALRWLGFAAAIPLTAAVAAVGEWSARPREAAGSPLLWWAVCLLLPLLADALLRRRLEWRLALFGLGAWLLATTHGRPGGSNASELWHSVGGYAVAASMALLMTWWGGAERRAERINLGVLGFAVVVGTYYFSNVMDKLNRSLSLLGLGALFFLLAYFLGKVRRRLLRSIDEGTEAAP